MTQPNRQEVYKAAMELMQQRGKVYMQMLLQDKFNARTFNDVSAKDYPALMVLLKNPPTLVFGRGFVDMAVENFKKRLLKASGCTHETGKNYAALMKDARLPLAQFNVRHISELKPDQYEAFAVAYENQVKP